MKTETIVKLHGILVRSARASADEAWDALAEAYTRLDTSRSDKEQCWYLLRVGKWSITSAVRKKYNAEGDIVEVHSDFETFASAIDFDGVPAPQGVAGRYVEYLSSGLHTCTPESTRTYLRRYEQTSSRKLANKTYTEVIQYAQRILERRETREVAKRKVGDAETDA